MITKADCPSKKADPYPGIMRKDNPSGSLLTRQQHIEKQVQDWIDHFEDSDQYQNESVSNKVRYLMRHIKVLNVTRRAATKILVELESKQRESDAQEESAKQMDVVTNEEGVDGDAIPVRDQHNQDTNNVDMIDEEPNSDVDMFSDDENPNNGQNRRESELELAKVLAKTDKELFEEGFAVSDKVKRSTRYNERKERYADQKLEGLSSQEILSTFSQNPLSVQDSLAMKNRLKHLPKQERANKTILKSIQDTIDALQNTPGHVAKDQLKVIVAAATHHRYGMPDIQNVSWRISKEAREIKFDLLKGNKSVLAPTPKAKRQIYPKELECLAIKHWNENTVPEPALHRRKAKSDDKETIPTRYQSLTDKEQYSLFQEDCGEEIKEMLNRYSSSQIEKVNQRPDSEDKTRRLAYFASLPAKVPSMDWYLDLKPSEVKPMHDHTTALCKACESAMLNYTTIVKTIRLQCKCKTVLCPNWLCLCDVGDDEEDQVPCNCKCFCENCIKCKVSHTLFFTNL